jgi:hypothetical protein
MPSEQNVFASYYQALLGSTFQQTVFQIELNNQIAAWKSLKTLYHSLPSKCRIDLETTYNSIIKKLEIITETEIQDSLFINEDLKALQTEFLEDKNLMFIQEIISSLEKHHYSIMDFSAKPLLEKRGKLVINP